jgi:hypothetical protein
MNKLAIALFLLASSASPSWAGSLTLSMHDGFVSVDAQDVTVRQILTEWARVGKTQIVDAERITGGPMTLKFDNVPEKQALDIILRSIPGYMALPRATQVADASLYERILIMATTTAVAAARPPSQGGMPGGPNVTQLRPAMPPPLFPGMLLEPPDSGDQITDDPAIAAAAAAGLIPVPGLIPGAPPIPGLMPPGGANQPAQPAPGAGAPTNPWSVPAGTAQPSLAPPTPAPQAPPAQRLRPPQADR